MNPNEKARAEGRGYYTHIRDFNHNFATRGLNARTAMLPCGVEGDDNSPLIGVIWVNHGPGDAVRGRHLHHGDAINLVVDGAMYMDGKWLRPGQAKLVPAELVYGDAITGPDGVVFLEIFETHDGAKPDFDDPKCQEYWNEVHGQYLFDH
jgi:hypothetical protein